MRGGDGACGALGAAAVVAAHGEAQGGAGRIGAPRGAVGRAPQEGAGAAARPVRVLAAGAGPGPRGEQQQQQQQQQEAHATRARGARASLSFRSTII